ncbi:High mobility group b protein 3 [Heracleum sosnowskyi]|uniref:High mobility group b protein 3 n=1 Tax=Heracleum sosnowskyi TaxID=360622 RepID=A0AAD8IS88_9APIA|nr:High mobility group b protein 3 [Heracleum sosnowskyi]
MNSPSEWCCYGDWRKHSNGGSGWKEGLSLSLLVIYFRKQFKEKNPAVKGVAAIGKAGGDRWRAMSDEDKAQFVTIAEQRKKDYEKKMQAYEKKQAGEDEEEESDKSKSEVNDDDEEGSDEEEDDD